jgi:ATP-dependent Clp protease ATP-binding subunit ClpC
MFERFTDRARQVAIDAQVSARRLGHGYVGTEHILLGLLQGDGVAARVLGGLGVTAVFGGHIPFTPRAKKVLELSLREALALKHKYIGTEHILLGLVREGEGLAMLVLVRLGAGPDAIRARVLDALRSTG